MLDSGVCLIGCVSGGCRSFISGFSLLVGHRAMFIGYGLYVRGVGVFISRWA